MKAAVYQALKEFEQRLRETLPNEAGRGRDGLGREV